MNKRSVISAFADMAIALSALPPDKSDKADKALGISSQAAARITGAFRACIILKNEKGELKIEGGSPHGAHGVGEKITGAAEKFLRAVMEGRKPVFINQPATSPQTAYMKDLALTHSIASVFFIPLLAEKETLGVMTFDFAKQKKKYLNDGVAVARFLAREIEVLRHKEREREKKERIQRLTLLGEHSAKIAHIIRNALVTIVGLLRRLKDSTSLSEHDKTLILFIFNAMASLERRVNQALSFAKFSPEYLNPKKEKIGAVLQSLVDAEHTLHPNIHIHFEKGSRDTELLINKGWIENCINDLILNAIDAGARNIWIATAKIQSEERFVIAVRNDGDPIDPMKINIKCLSEIFDPFVTTKENGFGLGLSIVKSMIQSHGGEIAVESITGCGHPNNSHTMFLISLPM